MAPTPARRTGALWLPLALVLAFALYGAAARREADFGVFHRTAVRVLEGTELYRLSDGDLPYKYAPVVALGLAPLGALPFQAAKAVWMALSGLALWRLFRWSAAQAGVALSARWHVWVLLLAAPYLLQTALLGQCEALLLAGIATSEAWARRRPARSGLLWALVCLTKPPFLVFALGGLVHRQGRRLAGLAAGLGLGLLLPALRYGWEGNLAQLHGWRALLGQRTAGDVCLDVNQSVFALLCEGGLSPGSAAFLPAGAAAGLLLCAGLLLASRRVEARVSGRGDALLVAGSFHLAAFLSPHGWWLNLLVLVPLAYLGVAEVAARRATPTLLAVLSVASLLVLAHPDLWGGPGPLFALLSARVHGWTGLALAAAVTANLLLKGDTGHAPSAAAGGPSLAPMGRGSG
jgi:hypothetical protein